MYDIVRDLLNFEAVRNGGKAKYPSLNTVRYKLKKIAADKMYVSSSVSMVSLDQNLSGAVGGKGAFESTDYAPVKYVLPSQWAIRDVQDRCSRNAIWGEKETSRVEKLFHHFSQCPVSTDRERQLTLFSIPSSSGDDVPLRKGMKVNFILHDTEGISEQAQKHSISTECVRKFGKMIQTAVAEVDHWEVETSIKMFTGKQDNYRDPSKPRNGDVRVFLCQTKEVYLVFRQLCFDRKNEYTIRFVLSENDVTRE